MKGWLVILCTCLFSLNSAGQTSHFFTSSDTLNKSRLWWVAGSKAGITTGGIITLEKAWYQYYDRGNFQLFNDNPEWLQMDKAGHVYSAFYLSDAGFELLRWAGVDKRKAAWIGAGEGSIWLLSMEIMDGFSTEWGFSWGDVLANTAGSGLFLFQELQWGSYRIRPKFSSQLSPYAQYRPRLLGNSFSERLLKDYNGQTYWLSFNLNEFGLSKLPPWLSFSAGYSGEGMISGRPDHDLYEGLPAFDRYRQYLLSLDVDFTKIPTRKKWLKGVFKALNYFKMPFPALEFNKNGLIFHPLYF